MHKTGRLQTSGHGVAAVNLGLPVRYAHTASGVIDRGDYDALVQLLRAIVGAFDATVLERIQMF